VLVCYIIHYKDTYFRKQLFDLKKSNLFTTTRERSVKQLRHLGKVMHFM